MVEQRGTGSIIANTQENEPETTCTATIAEETPNIPSRINCSCTSWEHAVEIMSL